MWMRIRAAHNITLIFKYLWQPTTYLHVLTNNRDTRLMQHGGIIFRMSVLWTRDLTPGHSTFMDWLWASCSHMCLCHRAVSFDTGCSIILILAGSTAMFCGLDGNCMPGRKYWQPTVGFFWWVHQFWGDCLEISDSMVQPQMDWNRFKNVSNLDLV